MAGVQRVDWKKARVDSVEQLGNYFDPPGERWWQLGSGGDGQKQWVLCFRKL